MIFNLFKHKKLLRTLRASFFLEKFQMEAIVLLFRTCVTGSYFFVHKTAGEYIFKQINITKAKTALIKNMTPYKVSVALAYSLPTIFLL